MKHYILDAHNLLHANGAWEEMMQQSLTDAREALVDAVELYTQRNRSHHFTIVFDGSDVGSRTRGGNIVLRGTRPSHSADDVIKQLIRKEQWPEHCIVVSSDDELIRFAQRNGCTAVKSPDFIARLTERAAPPTSTDKARANLSSSEKPSEISREEIEEMKRLFGL